MKNNLLIVAATEFEIAPLLQYLQEKYTLSDGQYEHNGLRIKILITGVGAVATTFQLTGLLSQQNQFQLAINAGIAGCFDKKYALGTVVNIVKDTFGDLGVEEIDGSYMSLFDLKFLNPEAFPFTNCFIENNLSQNGDFLPKVSAITVNKVSGTVTTINQLKQKWAVEMESMEGAAFAYVCSQFKVPYLQIRSISNYIEPRNKANWDTLLAINNLNMVLIQMIESLN